MKYQINVTQDIIDKSITDFNTPKYWYVRACHCPVAQALMAATKTKETVYALGTNFKYNGKLYDYPFGVSARIKAHDTSCRMGSPAMEPFSFEVELP